MDYYDSAEDLTISRSRATIANLERCKQTLWDDWSNCRDMHHELDTHIAHHKVLQAIDTTIGVLRKLEEQS